MEDASCSSRMESFRVSGFRGLKVWSLGLQVSGGSRFRLLGSRGCAFWGLGFWV